MIHYQLRCEADHRFDGWFRDSAAFERQAASGLVTCPECGDATVHRALMAPSIGRARATVDQEGASVPSKPPAPTVATNGGVLPDGVRAMLQKMRAEVERNSDYVGPAFAEEARKIHNGDGPKRSIYGETTPDQAQALADDGIEVTRIPWVPRADG